MSNKSPLICLITPGHVASTPRLVKNADALAEAGYRVHVIAGRNYPPADPLDAEIFAEAKWEHTLVDYSKGPAATGRKLRRWFARRLLARGSKGNIATAARAHHAEALHLAARAAALRADFYFGHCLAGLPAAALAAQRSGCSYGFDAEDLHDEETEYARADPSERSARKILQSNLLPGCRLFTCSTPLLATNYRDSYGIEPRVVLNVFPLSQAPATPNDPGPVTSSRPARFYWFSQTIGHGRGLEGIISVMGRMRIPTELHLRGFVSESYRKELQSLSAESGLVRPITFLSPGAPSEMARLAANADLGLSLEERHPLNRDYALTNKLFLYLLAGVPQILSHTSAHLAIAPDLSPAAVLVDLPRIDETAKALDAFLGNESRMAAARLAAWNLARRRFCWDIEKNIFIGAIREIERSGFR